MKTKKSEAAIKASLTVGCHPVKKEVNNNFYEKCRDMTKAREYAVKDFLTNYLQFNKSELDKIEIMEMKVSAKCDDTIYVALKDINMVKEIHWRVGEIKNPEIAIRNYIPPQFWRRYMYLNQECSKYREKYPNVKTLLRFGQKDVEIFMKTRGSEEPYKKVPFEEITFTRDIPRFEHDLKWTNNTNRSPRRKLIVHGNSNTGMETDSGVTNGIIRQRSSDSTGQFDDKKQKLSPVNSNSGQEIEEDEDI